MLNRFCLPILSAVLFSSVTNARADDVIARLRAVSDACSQDVQNLCKDVSPGGGRTLRCLGSNITTVSPACRDTMMSAINELCGQDLMRLCPGLSVSDPAAQTCLRSHRLDLKGTCKEAVARVDSSK
jgi:hypothetical protein